MLDSWLNSSALPALEQSAAFAQRRHMLLAGNIANMDVPGYKSRDISVDDFQSTLKEALESPGSLGGVDGISRSQSPAQKVRDVSKQVLFHDQSDVSLEQQVTDISKNQAMHDIAIGLMRSQFKSLQVAIRESVSV